MRYADPNVRSIVNADGAALLDVDRGTITTLNAVGAFIWQELGRGQSTESIIQSLAERTGEAASVIAEDLDVFLGTLAAQNFLHEGGRS
jgi:hypothetical protein